MQTHIVQTSAHTTAQKKDITRLLPLKTIQSEIISMLESLKISYPEAIYMVNWISVIKCIS